MFKVCYKKDLVKIENNFDFTKRKVHDFTYASEVIFRNKIVAI